MCILFYCSSKVFHSSYFTLTLDYHLPFPYWTRTHRSRGDKDEKRRQIVLVQPYRVASVLCNCHPRHYLSVPRSRRQWKVLHWFEKGQFLPASDLWSYHQCIPISRLYLFRSISPANFYCRWLDCTPTKSLKIRVSDKSQGGHWVRLKNDEFNVIVGTIATLISSIANIAAVFALKGHEPAFVRILRALV